MQHVETYHHQGMRVVIDYDPFPEDANPREGVNVGVMLCGHRRYVLGDEQIRGDDFSTTVDCPSCRRTGEDPERAKLWRKRPYGWVTIAAGSTEAMRGEMGRIIKREEEKGDPDAQHRIMLEICDCPRCGGDGEIELSLTAYLKATRDARVILPLGLIDHSGISMYVGNGAHRHDPGGWDSGQVGVIFDTAETRKECGLENASEREIEKVLREEVRIYDEYLRGQVYSFIVIDADGEHVDSCSGFLGGLEYVRSVANEAATCAARATELETSERHAMACRDIATV